MSKPGTQDDLYAALRWVAERQAELHRELDGLVRVHSALHMALSSRTEEPRPRTLSEGSANSDPYFFDFSAVDLTGCRSNRDRVRRLAEASDGIIRLRDAVDAVYDAGAWAGRRENLRTNLAKLLTEMGERIDRGVYRLT